MFTRSEAIHCTIGLRVSLLIQQYSVVGLAFVVEFHTQKYSVLQITRSCNREYKQCTHHGHLLVMFGVVINKTLTWNDHADCVTIKTNSSLAFIQRNFQVGQQHIKTRACISLVRPQVEYATAIWEPSPKHSNHT